jgi:small subunit ribosomal protein S17
VIEEEKQEPEETPEPPAEEPAVEPEAEAADSDPEAAESEPEAAEPDPEAAESEPEAAEAAAEAAEEPPAGQPAAAEAEDAPSPKELRKSQRSRATGPPRPPRTSEERATERAERRRASNERRRRYRAGARPKRGEPGTGTPAAPREPGAKKVRQGTVVSAGADKTITVEIAVVRRHRTYEKVVRRTSRFHAHDEANQAQEGDVVRIIESRPLSRTKRWRLLDVLERAPR